MERWRPQRELEEAAARELGFEESITKEMDIDSDSEMSGPEEELDSDDAW